MSATGPTLPTWAVPQVDSYLGYTGRDANVIQMAARDPNRLFNKVTSCNRRRYNSGRLTFHLR